MPQPKAYQRDTSFAELKGSQADVGAKLDQELDALGKGFDHVLKNLARIQEDDGRLKSGIVDGDALSSDTALGVRAAAEWVENFKYRVNDTVYKGFAVYRCRKAHKSEIFEKDLEALFWEPIVTFDKMIAEIVAVKEDAGFKRVSENMGPIGIIAGLSDKLDKIATNLELLMGIADKMPQINKVFALAGAIEDIETNMESLLKVAAIAEEVKAVAGSFETVNEAAQMAKGFIAVSENMPSIQKIGAMLGPLTDIAKNLDAVLDAPVQAARAEQAAARLGRQEKYNA